MQIAQIFPDITDNYVFSSAVIIPVITAVVQAVKGVGLKDKYAPLASIGLGVLIAILLRPDTEEITHATFTGIIYGLSASGLYSGIVQNFVKPNQVSSNTVAPNQVVERTETTTIETKNQK